MSELTEIRDHVARFPPFDSLPEDLLDRVVESIEVAYHRAGQQITALGTENHALRYIRSGSVEVRRRGGALYNVLGEGDIFGQFGLLRGGRVRFPTRALEDTLVYAIPAEVFHELCEQDEAFAEFVEVDRPRLGAGAEQQRGTTAMAVAPVMTLVHTPPVMVTADSTVQEAAQRLSESRTTAVLVIDFQNEYFDAKAVPGFAGGRMVIPDGEAALRQARRVVEFADAHGIRVIHVQHVLPAGAPLFAQGSVNAAFHRDLQPRQGETVVQKDNVSVFAGASAAVLDPMSLLTFPILPAARLPRDQSISGAAMALVWASGMWLALPNLASASASGKYRAES